MSTSVVRISDALQQADALIYAKKKIHAAPKITIEEII
jgi:hypothetical protein